MHRPLTDFWRVGKGYAAKLEAHGMRTMGDVARCSIQNEGLLYKLFGVNAELLIDHAWGWEPATIADIKAYKPEHKSVGSGQVLKEPYNFDKGRLIVREMADLLSLDLVDKGLLTGQLTLTVGYDMESLRDGSYTGEVSTDHYGRKIPKHAHGTVNLDRQTSSTKMITDAVLGLYERAVNPKLLIRRVYLTAEKVVPERLANQDRAPEQMDLFTDYRAEEEKRAAEDAALARERRRQQAILRIQKKYGKNAILKGMNLEDGATTIERNGQIGGHKA